MVFMVDFIIPGDGTVLDTAMVLEDTGTTHIIGILSMAPVIGAQALGRTGDGDTRLGLDMVLVGFIPATGGRVTYITLIIAIVIIIGM